jgi:hypothetical protein
MRSDPLLPPGKGGRVIDSAEKVRHEPKIFDLILSDLLAGLIK